MVCNSLSLESLQAYSNSPFSSIFLNTVILIFTKLMETMNKKKLSAEDFITEFRPSSCRSKRYEWISIDIPHRIASEIELSL
mmetsp:Transcript_31591/g.36066  ORF Transcript_31591/g.36066 Transcript_31591/m.36066 type:complete len:82 (-) Transcript_31591:28-273(-)